LVFGKGFGGGFWGLGKLRRGKGILISLFKSKKIQFEICFF